MAFALWTVKGRFVIPGTRKHGNFGPIRVAAASKQQASADLAPALNEQFRKELPEETRFSKHWAMMNLQWEQFSPKKAAEDAAMAKLQAEAAPIPEQTEG